eukprot:4900587-Amphidinium_carterae.1
MACGYAESAWRPLLRSRRCWMSSGSDMQQAQAERPKLPFGSCTVCCSHSRLERNQMLPGDWWC